MKLLIQEFFANNAHWIIFLHVLSAIVWVGGMIAIRFAVHPAMQHIDDAQTKLARTLEALRNFFLIVIPMIVILIITAAVMAIGFNFKEVGGFMYGMVHVKEALWTIMTINFVIIYVRRNRAERSFLAGDLAECKRQLGPVSKIFIPVNIFLGLIAVFIGITLRGM